MKLTSIACVPFALLTLLTTTVAMAASAPSKAPRPAAMCAGPRVVTSTLSHAVEGRHPVAEAIAFEPGDTVFALSVVENLGPKGQIEMTWKRDGLVRSRVSLDVGSAKGWRTWSKHTLSKKDAGAWTVEVRSVDGTLLDSLAFEVATMPSVADL
jgi:hypothetical protein